MRLPVWAWLMLAEYADFSLSFISVPLFSSNFQFWQASAYFQSTAELKSRLPTWNQAGFAAADPGCSFSVR